ncbi:MAG: hypothetical protein OI860_00455 (plasmid) [Candidatus Methanoperedens sp.]|nr:MAG: hypothetical protein OI863_00010 [Candidatus Methanoperedens sp.]WAM22265.1 MAG: hypothetical protein OI860_00455 [Candidatus Methanoperedens sp.]
MKRMSESNEVVLWMEKCAPERLASNKVMLCTRNIFLLENMRDMFIDEYEAILKGSGNAGIIKL